MLITAFQPAGAAIQELCFSNHTWRTGLCLPVTTISSSPLAASSWLDSDKGEHIRVYYQSPEHALLEHCHDTGVWQVGNYSPGKVPAGSSISALAWFKETKQLEVFWQDDKGDFVGQKYSVAAGRWQDMGLVVPKLGKTSKTAALHWNSGDDLIIYYQNSEKRDVLEHRLRGQGATGTVNVVAKG
jgi:hypothetical protein